MHALFDPSLFFAALLTWSEQAGVLTAAGALAAVAMAHPKGRLAMWQGLLLILLLLPAVEPWKAAPKALLVAAASSGVVATAVSASVASPALHWRVEYWLWLIAAGAALRLVWVAAGFVRLRGYRRQARRLSGPPLRFACDVAAWYASDSVPGPVTYGWRRPVILLPSRVLELPAELSEAIECHELIHVRRNDWLWVMGETLVRSALWFHPAIWLVLSRIQLAREQVVDREAVSLLQNRDGYLDALVAVAGYQLRPDLAPAPLFLRKRHLVARVKAVMKEVKMTGSRMAAGAAAACSAVTMAVYAAMWLFPFVGSPVVQAQTAPDSPGVTVDAGGALLHRAPVRTSIGSTAAGTVAVEATLDATGEVSDARVISGPQELRKDALASVLQWHYQPGAKLAEISIRFESPVAAPAAPKPAIAASSQSVAVVAPRPAAPPLPSASAPATFPATVKSISFQGVSPEAEQELRSRLGVREGDSVSESDMANARSAARSVDGHFVTNYSLTSAPGGGSEVTLQVRVAPQAAASATAVKMAPPGAQAAQCVKCPAPTYPAIAKQARIQGSVVLDTTIGPDGTVQRMQVMSSANPLLTPAAMDAVKQWVYQPTMLNGAPVAVSAPVTVNFSLQ
jgi:TonB family protein